MKVSAMVMFLFFLFLLAMATSASSPSVIVIGAGISGIMAAKTLSDAGYRDILILEANDWIGGRIHKVHFGGQIVELGANWLHGVGGPLKNPLYEIADKIQLKSFLSDYNNLTLNTYKQEGGLYPKEVVEAALKAADERDAFSTNMSRLLISRSKRQVDMSIWSSQRLLNKPPVTPLDMVIDYFYNDYEDAEPPRMTSLINTIPRHEFTDFGDDQYFVADTRGFEGIVHHIAQQFLSYKNGVISDPRLKLNKVVREVIYSRNGVRVKTEDGSVYQAKYAILSVSLGVLQSGLIEFKPPMPQWKKVALSEFNMVIFTKIFLKFPYKFWPTGNGTEFFLYAHGRRGYYPIWQHLEMELPGSNFLLVLVTDEESLRIEQQPDETTKAEAMEVLRKIFGKNIPNAEDILVPRWWSNRFYKGTFSNWPAGYSEQRHQQLTAPLGPIYFTGEYVSLKYFGYADGAYYAGRDVANDLIECDQKRSCKGIGKVNESNTMKEV